MVNYTRSQFEILSRIIETESTKKINQNFKYN